LNFSVYITTGNHENGDVHYGIFPAANPFVIPPYHERCRVILITLIIPRGGGREHDTSHAQPRQNNACAVKEELEELQKAQHAQEANPEKMKRS
jgi:hypothetical protein